MHCGGKLFMTHGCKEEAKSAERALRESEQRLAGILGSVTDHMSVMDEQLNIIWVNNVARCLFGQDLIGRFGAGPMVELVPGSLGVDVTPPSPPHERYRQHNQVHWPEYRLHLATHRVVKNPLLRPQRPRCGLSCKRASPTARYVFPVETTCC